MWSTIGRSASASARIAAHAVFESSPSRGEGRFAGFGGGAFGFAPASSSFVIWAWTRYSSAAGSSIGFMSSRSRMSFCESHPSR